MTFVPHLRLPRHEGTLNLRGTPLQELHRRAARLRELTSREDKRSCNVKRRSFGKSIQSSETRLASRQNCCREGVNLTMLLTLQQRNEVFAKHGCYAKDCCDRCGQLLGPVRFTRRGESGIWCSQKCRGDGDRTTIRKGGRPRRYKTEHDRREAERRQNAERQKAFRERVQRNGKPSPSFAETKDLQAQKTPLSHYLLTRPFPARKTGLRETGSAKKLNDGNHFTTRVEV